MIRRLFNIAAALSLLLCVATVALWIMSQWVELSVAGSLDRAPNGLPITEWFCVRTKNGQCMLEIDRQNLPTIIDDQGRSPAVATRLYDLSWRINYHVRATPREILEGMKYWVCERRGFYVTGSSVEITAAVAPLWPIVLLFAGLPLLKTLLQRRKRRRESQGFCRKCGYDLRASKTRCPECGLTFTSGGSN
jgi:hypothetical protein